MRGRIQFPELRPSPKAFPKALALSAPDQTEFCIFQGLLTAKCIRPGFQQIWCSMPSLHPKMLLFSFQTSNQRLHAFFKAWTTYLELFQTELPKPPAKPKCIFQGLLNAFGPSFNKSGIQPGVQCRRYTQKQRHPSTAQVQFPKLRPSPSIFPRRAKRLRPSFAKTVVQCHPHSRTCFNLS